MYTLTFVPLKEQLQHAAKATLGLFTTDVLICQSRKSAGGTNYSNHGSVPWQRDSKPARAPEPWNWSSWINRPSFMSLFNPVLFLLRHVRMSSVENGLLRKWERFRFQSLLLFPPINGLLCSPKMNKFSNWGATFALTSAPLWVCVSTCVWCYWGICD